MKENYTDYTVSTGGRSLSMPYRVGTWLPVKMTQQIIPLRTQIFIAAIVALATLSVLNSLK